MLADNNYVCVVKVRLLDAFECAFSLGHLQRMVALTLIVDGRAAALACRLCQGSALNFLLHAHGLC